MNKLRKILVLALFMLMPIMLVGCFESSEGVNGKFMELSMSRSDLCTTQTTYYRGDGFSLSNTFIDMTYYRKSDNIIWELEAFTLPELKGEISDVEYAIDGFDSSEVTSSQEITITISSPTYGKSLTTRFTIEIKPEYIVESEVYDDSAIKDVYLLNESFDCTNLQIKNTYSNGREEFINVTGAMVTGFNTATATAGKRTLTINYEDQTFDYDYAVAPSENYDLFDNGYFKVFVPNEKLGYEDFIYEGIYGYKKSNISSLLIGVNPQFSHAESYLKNVWLNPSGSFVNSNVIIVSYGSREINGINATICKFRYQGESTVFTGIYFDVGVYGSTAKRTIEIIYYGTTETAEVLDTVLSSMVI